MNEWIEDCERELAVVDQELIEVTKRHSQLRRRLDMLLGLRSSFETSEGGSSSVSTSSALDGFELFVGPRGRGVKERIVSQTRGVLQDAGRPLHISEILEAFRLHGYEIPGKGEPVNISVHLSKTDQVVLTGRGQYGLPEWEKGRLVTK